MRIARTGTISLTLCLTCVILPLGGISAAAEPEVSGADGRFESYLVQSVDYYAAGDFERSLQAAKSALVLLDKNSAVAYNNICSAQMRLGAYEEAVAACQKSLALLPGYGRAWENLGWIYTRMSEQTPTVGAYLNLSLARYWQGGLEESVAASRRALELEPDSAIAHNNICAALARGGQWEQAVLECELALTIDPDYERAKNNLEWARSQDPY